MLSLFRRALAARVRSAGGAAAGERARPRVLRAPAPAARAGRRAAASAGRALAAREARGSHSERGSCSY